MSDAPDRVWAWKWNYIGPNNRRTCWTPFPPGFDHLMKLPVESSWNPFRRVFWAPKKETPHQDVTVYRRDDLPPTDAQILAHPKVQALVYALENCVWSIEHANMADGVCCCGEEIDGHSDPMSCGHSPVDQGKYYADLALNKARAAITAMEPKP